MHPGTRQDERLAPALQARYFLPDEFGLPQRLRMLLAQSARLRFVTLDGEPGGHWDEALLRDETIVLADIGAFPLEREQAAFMASLSGASENDLWMRCWQLAERLDLWAQRLADHQAPAIAELSAVLSQFIARNLSALVTKGLQTFGLPRGDIRRMNQAWGFAALPATLLRGRALPDDPYPGDERHRQLRRIWAALCHVIGCLRPLALARLRDSLTTGRHEPAMGLLLAFLQVFQLSRESLNRFPQRFTDFYYDRVLRMQAREAGVEQVYLLLERDPRYSQSVQISRGLRFIGGKDAGGKAIAFAADQALEVTTTAVAELITLRLESDGLVSPEREFRYATRAKAEHLPLLKPEAAYVAQPPWWPLFGGNTKSSASDASDATLGIAIATPLLALAEGEREVHLEWQLAHPADRDHRLLALLRTPVARRDEAWLTSVFEQYQFHEQAGHPERDLGGQAQTSPSAGDLAKAALQRGSQFGNDVQLCFLVSRCLATDDADRLSQRLGRLFAVWLTAAREDLRPADLHALRQHAAQLLGDGEAVTVAVDDPLSLIFESNRPPERALIFDRVFRGIFNARLSGATGWLEVGDVYLQRRAADDGGALGAGLQLSLRMGADQPAVVPCQPKLHGEGWPAQPLLQLRLQNQTLLYAFSLLQQLELLTVTIGVGARGLRNLVLHNQLGRLDPGKPFNPFGPLPDLGSYLIVGCAEVASKPVDAVALHLQWGRLPPEDGGFQTHYKGYPGQWSTDRFQAQLGILRDGQWQHGSGPKLTLFHDDDGSLRLAAGQTLQLPSIDLRRLHRATAVNPLLPFDFGLHSRNGFFRLELSDPPGAFGHAAYPHLLTDVLTRNARLKLELPLPAEPYTPTLESITLDYQASQRVRLDDDNALNTAQLFHLHPFGVELVHPSGRHDRLRLLPVIPNDGNLYIGLSGGDPQGTLSLFFHLRREVAAERWTDRRPALQWSVWSDEGWLPLPMHQQISDSTQGLLRSGIICLNLPAGMSPDCAQLPGKHYWLRLSADWGFDCFAGLYGVHAQAISATRVEAATTADPPEPLPPGTVRNPQRGVAGLRSVQQVGPSWGRRAVDPPMLVRTRSAERLRHKSRASTPWDYERLVLDAFPEVYKVKCFSHLRLPQGLPREHQPSLHDLQRSAGHVLVVVVPAPRDGVLFSSTEAPRLDADLLEQITALLRDRCTPGASLIVRNAAYERLQVRCALRLQRGVHAGSALRRINKALVEFLSPWHEDGFGADFDWEVRADVVEGFLRSLDEVDAVGELSLLHIVSSDQHLYRLHDTARTDGAQHDGSGNVDARLSRVRPQQPWSLMLPTRRHLFDLLDDPAREAPQQTGIDRLEIGNTFIIGGRPDAD